MRHLALALLLILGCGGEPPCSGNCPDLAGAYAIRLSSVTGFCDFLPYEVGPSLELSQSEEGRRISSELIDPINRLPVRLVGDVFAPPPGADEDLLGSFSVGGRAARLDQGGLAFEVRLSGTVREQAGRRSLSATLTTLGTREARTSCQVVTVVEGEGPPLL